MMRMRLFGSIDGNRFFEMKPGVRKMKGHRFYGSSDNGETFFPIQFTKSFKKFTVAGNAKAGTVVEFKDAMQQSTD